MIEVIERNQELHPNSPRRCLQRAENGLVTTEHSTYSGRVLQVEDGGLIFQISDTLTEICNPWEKVNYFGRITKPADAAARVGERGPGAKVY